MKEENRAKKIGPSRSDKPQEYSTRAGRVIAFLTREELDFIDKVGKDALFSTGKKLSRSNVIQALVRAVKRLHLTGRNIHTVDELEDRIFKLAQKAVPTIAQELRRGGF